MRPRQQVIAFEAALFEVNAMCTPALLAGAKAQNVSSCRRTGPIDAQRCSLRFGLKVTQTGHSAKFRVASRESHNLSNDQIVRRAEAVPAARSCSTWPPIPSVSRG